MVTVVPDASDSSEVIGSRKLSLVTVDCPCTMGRSSASVNVFVILFHTRNNCLNFLQFAQNNHSSSSSSNNDGLCERKRQKIRKERNEERIIRHIEHDASIKMKDEGQKGREWKKEILCYHKQ